MSDTEQAKRELESLKVALQQAEKKLETKRTQICQLQDALDDRHSHLLYTQKMAILGALIAGISHEIKTPIGAICSMQDTLTRAVDKLRKALEKAHPETYKNNRAIRNSLQAIDDANRVIGSGSTRTLEIVRRVRKFSRMDQAELIEADLHDEIEDTLLLLHNEMKNRIEIIKNYGHLPKVKCNVGQISQVFLNVLVNASQAIEGHGSVTITTAVVGDEVQIVIEDTGSGIKPENLARIFEPGFTTKKVGVGTGIGLSICCKILQYHRGRIDVQSVVGQGTKVSIVFPKGLESCCNGFRQMRE